MFDLQGHRFARGLFPENTLEGFDAACRLGLASFEIDIAVTRDGIPVIHHDPALNPNTTRGPDGAWLEATGPLIRDLSFAELQRYDVGRLRPGSAYAATYATQTAQDGARIPTLDALLRRRSDIRFNIELKSMPAHPEWTVAPEEMVERVLNTVDAVGAADRIAIQSFDWRAPRHARRVRPDLAVGWLTEAKTIHDAALWRGIPGTSTALDAVPAAIMAEGGGHWGASSFRTDPNAPRRCARSRHASHPVDRQRPGGYATSDRVGCRRVDHRLAGPRVAARPSQ